MIIFILLVLAVSIYLWYISLQIYWKKGNVPFETPWPLFGNMARSVFRLEHFVETLQRVYKKHSNVKYFGFFNFQKPVIVIKDPELIKMITIKDFEAFPDHQSLTTNSDDDPLWSKNLFSIQGLDKWRRLRATLSPTFTSSKMRMMFKLMSECSVNFTNYYLQKDGIIKIDAKDAFTRYSSDIIATTAFGISIDSSKNRDNEFFLMGKQASNLEAFFLKFLLYNFSPLLAKVCGVKVFNDKISNFFRKLIKDHIRLREEQGIVRPDMIHLLMEARKGKDRKEPVDTIEDNSFSVVEESEIIKDEANEKAKLTDDDITAQALVFFIAGFDSISRVISFAAVELAAHPEIQEKLSREIDRLYGECGDNPSYEQLLHLKYLDMVLSETLRKWSPGLFLDRKAAGSYTLPPAKEGDPPSRIEKGSIVWIPVYQIHRDENYYPSPASFNPERFSDENKNKIMPFTYLPFGLGPRNCIGSRFALLEAKVVLYQLLAKFELIPVEETNIPIELDKTQFQPTPKGGFMIGLRKRNK